MHGMVCMAWYVCHGTEEVNHFFLRLLTEALQQGSPDKAVSPYKAASRYKAVKIAWRDWGIAPITRKE